MLTTPTPSIAALRKIARALAQATDLDTALDRIAHATTEVMAVDSCSIYLLDPDNVTLRLQATTGLDKRALGRAALKLGEGMTGWAAHHNQPVFSDHAQSDPRFRWVNQTNERIFQSLLAVPLESNGQVIGALNVQTRRHHQFDPNQVETLLLIGDLAAGTLAKTQLYDRQARQLAEMQALATVSQTAIRTHYLDDMLDVVCDMSAKVMNAAVCAIYLLSRDGSHIELRAAHQTGQYHYRPSPQIAIGEGLTGRVAQSGTPHSVENLAEDPHYLNHEQARRVGLQSLLAVPLTVRDRVIGVLNCYTTDRRDFTAEQIGLLDTLSNQTALAIENARLMTNAAMLRETHHRIKNNLQTVAMLMRLQLSSDRTVSARDVLHESIGRIQSIAAVHEVLSERGFQLVEVNDVLQRVTQITASSLHRPGLDVTVTVAGELITLHSRAATALALVANELVQNALEHGFKHRQQGTVTITLSHTPQAINLVVRDDGSGLPNDYRPGLGLEIMQTLVNEDLHGELTLHNYTDDSGSGTEAIITLPRILERA